MASFLWKEFLKVVFISCTLYGVTGLQLAFLKKCQVPRCERLIPKIEWNNPYHVLPSAERLWDMCPQLDDTFDCILEEFGKCAQQDIGILLTSEDEALRADANIIFGATRLISKMCDSSNWIHQVYLENVDCIRGVVYGPEVLFACIEEAGALYRTYKFGERKDKDEEHCIVAAHVFACVSKDIQRECGKDAKWLLIEVLKTSNIKRSICTSKNIQDLKTKYINHLPLVSDRRKIFEEVFNVRRKK